MVATLGAAPAGSGRPLVVTSGTGLVRSSDGGPVTEADDPAPSDAVPRAASEEAARAQAGQGATVMVLRLPQVHDSRRQGRIHRHIQIAREQGRVAHVGAGRNRVPAVHVCDLPASGAWTQQQLDWRPTGPDLLTDLRDADYDVA